MELMDRPHVKVMDPRQRGDGASQSAPRPPPPSVPEPEVVEIQEPERAPSPLLPKKDPSGVMQALIRLTDLEEQMEYAFAKHTLLLARHKEIQAQTALLEDLPVGMEAFKEELDKLMAEHEAKVSKEKEAAAEAEALYSEG
jgi:hypothetical protein